jgi:hypothetical protein
MFCGQKSANRVRPGKPRGLTARFGDRIKARVPLGYENETSFQFGEEAIPSFLERPSENGTRQATDLSPDAHSPE